MRPRAKLLPKNPGELYPLFFFFLEKNLGELYLKSDPPGLPVETHPHAQ